MSTNKLCTPTKGSPSRYTMESDCGNAYTTCNPFEVLDAVVKAQSNGSGSTGSPTSSGGSTSQKGYAGGGAALGTPSRGSVPSGSQLMQQERDLNSMPPQQMRRMSGNAFASPAQSRMSIPADYSLGSPQKMTPPRRLGMDTQPFSSPQASAMRQRHDSLASQTSPTSRSGSGRVSFNSNLRAPTMLQDLNASSLTGIPEILAVQEMAFRQGQHSHGVSRERVPSSPFAKQFDQIWADFYVLGKEFGGTPANSVSVTPASSHQNFSWPILINPYTQDLERPNGAIDAEWVRKICVIALNCMAALIGAVCRRKGEWRKIICDVPAQIQKALTSFEDLRTRYENLKRDAREAVGGGLPVGY